MARVDILIAEFVGTYFLVLTIGLNVLQNTPLAPVAIGSMLMVMIFASGHVSGGHFNPAVTIAVLLSGRDAVKPSDVGLYLGGQFLGAYFATATYILSLGASFTLAPGKGYTMWEVVTVEVLFSMALAFVVLNTGTLAPWTQPKYHNEYNGLAIGFTVMAAAFAIGPISGCSLNPAVSLSIMTTHFVLAGIGQEIKLIPQYVLAPFVGAALAAVLFKTVVRKREMTIYEKTAGREIPTSM
jgi:aquaporin Z